MLIGDLLVNDYRTLPVGTALAQTIGNVLECVVAAWLLHRLVRTRSPLDTLDGLARGLCALAAGVAVSATVGVAASWIGEVISFDATPHIWRTWVLGDISGALIVVPLAVAWSELPSLRLDRRLDRGAVVVVGILAGATEAAFRATHPLVYLVFPALVWSAVRFGKRGATLALVISSALAVWNVTRYDGPFTFHSISHSVLATQLYIVVGVATTLSASRRGRRAGAAGRSARCVADRDARRRRDRAAPSRARPARRRAAAAACPARASAARGRCREPSVLDYADGEIAAARRGAARSRARNPPGRASGAEPGERAAQSRRAFGDPVTFSHLPDERLPEPVQEAVYYIVAEALANAQKHSRASSIRVRVAAEDGHVLVETSDNGVGGASETDGSGLRGLRGRAADLGGTFTVWSPAGRGTRLCRRPSGRVIRVVHGEDNVLIREGVGRILAGAPDLELVGTAEDLDGSARS